MNDLADELRSVYEYGLKNDAATVEAVLFGIRRNSDIVRLIHSAYSSRTSVIREIITLSGIGREIEPMISLGCNLSTRVKILE